ncbi:MAG: hypothetical protein AAF907_14100, partial [Planctomycetota bacterium]
MLTRSLTPLRALLLATAAGAAGGGDWGAANAGPPSAVQVSPGVMQRLRTPAGRPVEELVRPTANQPFAPPADDESGSQAAGESAEDVRRWTAFEENAEQRNWRWIVVHHTATASGSVASIDAAHR